MGPIVVGKVACVRRRPAVAALRRSAMGTIDHDTQRARPESGIPDAPDAAAALGTGVASDHPLGSHAAQILATEHWSLLAARTLIWNEAMSRVTVFLTVLSAAIIALALLADATGFGPQTTTLALVLLPVVLFLGIAAHGRLVDINREEVELVLAMNRLRHAYLQIAPALEPYLSTGHHDDEPGLAASYLRAGGGGPRLGRWIKILVKTPTIVGTVDAALAAAIVVLVVRAAEAATTVAVAAGALAFLVVWAVLFSQQRRALDPLRRTTPRFPTPPDQA